MPSMEAPAPTSRMRPCARPRDRSSPAIAIAVCRGSAAVLAAKRRQKCSRRAAPGAYGPRRTVSASAAKAVVTGGALKNFVAAISEPGERASSHRAASGADRYRPRATRRKPNETSASHRRPRRSGSAPHSQASSPAVRARRPRAVKTPRSIAAVSASVRQYAHSVSRMRSSVAIPSRRSRRPYPCAAGGSSHARRSRDIDGRCRALRPPANASLDVTSGSHTTRSVTSLLDQSRRRRSCQKR